MVDPEKIRRRLEEVWAGLGSDAGDHGVLRACAMTLVVVTDDDGDASALSETLAALMPEHPSRVIVVRLSPGSEDLVEADVEAQCWMPFGQRRQICSEQIVIRCTATTLGEIPGVILPLIVPDLPVVLWCPSERAWRADSFPALAEPAGRILVDTARAARPAEALLALAAQAKRGAPVADLSWTRLTRWRGLLAQAFENHLCRRQKQHFAELAVSYQGTAGSPVPATAILMAGWITSRLGWPPGDGKRWSFTARDADLEPGKLASLELRCLEPPTSRIAITRLAGSWAEIRVEAGHRGVVMSRVALAPSTDLLLLSEELGIQERDSIFEESLAAAAEIAGALVKK